MDRRGGGPPAAFHISTNTAMGCRASGNLVAPCITDLFLSHCNHNDNPAPYGHNFFYGNRNKELAMQVALLKDEEQ